MQYSKVRFTSKYNGNTTALVLTDKQQSTMTISEISALFPMYEALKMERIERGEYYDTWEGAFNSDM